MRCAFPPGPRRPLGLWSAAQIYTALSPQTPQRELAVGNEPILHMMIDGWREFERVVDTDVCSLVRGLHADPSPLCDALDRYLRTLVHADARAEYLCCIAS